MITRPFFAALQIKAFAALILLTGELPPRPFQCLVYFLSMGIISYIVCNV